MDIYVLREKREFEELNIGQKVSYFSDVAKACFHYWNIPPYAKIKLLNYTENATFVVKWSTKNRLILRIHRQWYTSKESILSEISWLLHLTRNFIDVPKPIPTISGEYVAEIETMYGIRCVDCVEYEEGSSPVFSENTDFAKIGSIIGKIHMASFTFEKPTYYARIEWDYEGTFSSVNNFHNESYEKNLVLNETEKSIIRVAVNIIREKLFSYGKNSGNYGLIHSDCRFANILQRKEEYVILDFDDCGNGWFMYDLASVFGFNENHPYIETAKRELLIGYQSVRELSNEDIEMFDTFLMMRQIGLVGTGMFFEKYAVLGDGECNKEVKQWHDFYHNTASAAAKYIEGNRNM